MTKGPVVIGSTAPWQSGVVLPTVECVLAPNASPMTLDGTNTWILGAPGSSAVLVDPGPSDPVHLAQVRHALAARDQSVATIVLTHGHDDHSAGARLFAESLAAPVRALDPRHRYGSEGLSEGDVIAVGDVELRVVGTPGHSPTR